MFTGLVEEIGLIQAATRQQGGVRFVIFAERVLEGLEIGDSVAVSGVCLTVVKKGADHFAVDAVQETLQRSTLARWTEGTAVNLERALPVGGRVGGHFVQGHVDGIGRVQDLQTRSPGYWLTLQLSGDCAALCVEKGSIAIDGVSLTIADVNEEVISLAVIPHTAEHTTLCRRRSGDEVNVETDLLGKYVQRLLTNGKPASGLTLEKLFEWGF
ncbi:riboflavin synthase [bacterium]|nr:riboflavin synthase [bacterium]